MDEMVVYPLALEGVTGEFRLSLFFRHDNKHLVTLSGDKGIISNGTETTEGAYIALAKPWRMPSFKDGEGPVCLLGYLSLKLDGLFVTQAILVMEIPMVRGSYVGEFMLVRPPEKRDQPRVMPSGIHLKLMLGGKGYHRPPEDYKVIDTSSVPSWAPWSDSEIRELVYKSRVASPNDMEDYFDRIGSNHMGEQNGLTVDWVGQIPCPYWATDLADPRPLVISPSLLATVEKLIADTRMLDGNELKVIDTSGDPEHSDVCLRYFQLVVQLLAQIIPYHRDEYSANVRERIVPRYGTKYRLIPDQLTNPLVNGAGDCEDKAILSYRVCVSFLLAGKIEGETAYLAKARKFVKLLRGAHVKEGPPSWPHLCVVQDPTNPRNSHCTCLLPLPGKGYLDLDGVYPYSSVKPDKISLSSLNDLARRFYGIDPNIYLEKHGGHSGQDADDMKIYQMISESECFYIREGTQRETGQYGAPLSHFGSHYLHYDEPDGLLHFLQVPVSKHKSGELWDLKPNPNYLVNQASFTVLQTSEGYDASNHGYATRFWWNTSGQSLKQSLAFIEELLKNLVDHSKASYKIVKVNAPPFEPPLLVVVYIHKK